MRISDWSSDVCSSDLRFEKIVLLHGVRFKNELAYSDFIQDELPNNEYFGDIVRDKLIYYPCVTREPFRNEGRITHVVETGKLFTDIGLPPLDTATDRAMLGGRRPRSDGSSVGHEWVST